MNLLTLSVALISISLGITIIFLINQRKKIKRLNSQINSLQKNHEYLVHLMRDLQDIFGYGSDMTLIVDLISKSLQASFPAATISSIQVKDDKLVFKSQLNEAVNHAFINKIKDDLITGLGLPQDQSFETEESITGVTPDDLGKSEIRSSTDMQLTVNFQTRAIINISSTTENLYSEVDKKILSTISYLVSGFLTRIELLLEFEKSKSIAMIDSFSDGIFMVDMSNKLIAINDSALKFLNLKREHLDINDVFSGLPNTYNFNEKIGKCIVGNQTCEENDVSINGKIFKIVITPVFEINSLHKGVIGASVLLHDVTLEKSLTQVKEDFTNIMVHELRSPLTAIKASSEFLSSQADFTPDEKKRLVEMISESSKKMLDKIALILDSAKMDAGLFNIRKTESDLKKLIENRIATFTPLASEKSIGIKVEVDTGIPLFSFDPSRIDEVINNLLSNSLKFTPVNGTISIQAKLVMDKVIISVADTGEGIAKENQSKLFTKYQQAPGDVEHAGTGLGLYVVKEVVESHGGTVSLESEVGQGTTITFTLPLHQAAAKALPEMPTLDSTPATPQKLVN